MANNWINAKEKLPDENQDVLIAIKNGENYSVSMATYRKHYGVMKWVEPNYDYYGAEEITLNVEQVNYWQPMPEPPKGE